MSGVDDTLTKLTGDVLVAVSEQVRHLIGKGLIEPEKLQLTIEARRERAKELVDAGMSQRQAAVVLGVNEKTVRNDLRNNSAENAEEVRTTTAEIIEPDSKPVNFPGREEKREALVRKNEALAAVEIEAPRQLRAMSHLRQTVLSRRKKLKIAVSQMRRPLMP